MERILKTLPIPVSGLVLALASTGNLVLSYGNIYRSFFGILAGVGILLLILKVIFMPLSVKEGFENPVIASVLPTFSMALMILSTYVKNISSTFGLGVWILGLIIHIILILLFTKKYIFNFNIKRVFPSYFIVYVGIVCGSVTAPAFGLNNLGQGIFWFGFISYLILLPVIVYRVFVVKEIPEPAIPTLTIFTAPASLCLAGYLNSFGEKNGMIIGFLGVISFIMFTGVMVYIYKMLRLSFYPSYSAFTFPFVITAISMKGTNAYLMSMGREVTILGYYVKFLEAWAVGIVLYVLFRYIHFIVTNLQSSSPINTKGVVLK